jgi:predicted enzyme related to lactoylglutathione lyase
MPKVVHFEIPADDVERATSFTAPSLTGSFKQYRWVKVSTRR